MKEITLNLSTDLITTDESVVNQITRKEFWVKFLHLLNINASDKEIEVLSCYLTDEDVGRVPSTVYKSLENKGYLVDKKLTNTLQVLKDKLIQDKFKLIFNYEITG